MTVYAVVETLNAGHDHQKQEMEELDFRVGSAYEVEHISMGQSSTSIELKDYPNKHFNSVFFEFEEDGKPLDIYEDARFNPYLDMY